MWKLCTTPKTNFQFGNAYFNYGYARIVYVAMSDASLKIFLPCGMTESIYFPNIRLEISLDLLLCVLQL